MTFESCTLFEITVSFTTCLFKYIYIFLVCENAELIYLQRTIGTARQYPYFATWKLWKWKRSAVFFKYCCINKYLDNLFFVAWENCTINSIENGLSCFDVIKLSSCKFGVMLYCCTTHTLLRLFFWVWISKMQHLLYKHMIFCNQS